MTATNHILSGALIGAILPLPVAIPLAFLSHFILDKIPHFAVEDEQRNKSVLYKSVVYGDILLAIGLAVVIVALHKWSMLIAGFVAYSPDTTLIFYYFKHDRNFNIKPKNGFMKFHLAMQYERPWGILPEAAVAVGLVPFFINRLLN